MSRSRLELAHLARLAGLSLGEEEIAALGPELDAIVGYVERLAAVPTDGVPPMTTVAEGAVRRVPLRSDVPHAGLTHEDALANAPAAEGGGFAVPAFVGSS